MANHDDPLETLNRFVTINAEVEMNISRITVTASNVNPLSAALAGRSPQQIEESLKTIFHGSKYAICYDKKSDIKIKIERLWSLNSMVLKAIEDPLKYYISLTSGNFE